ncbi:MAG: lipoyl synthase [Leptonema sp. (in: bacteria)]
MQTSQSTEKNRTLPWLRIPIKFATYEDFQSKANLQLFTKTIIQKNQLKTVCEEASCPNLNHCWSRGTATFLIMGDTCTRRCKFCDIHTGKPKALDPEEPLRLANTVKAMNLKHIVITSVDRDDLKDCGSTHFANCILEVRKLNPTTTIEVLIPDFKGKEENLERIFKAKPEVINHNIETVPSLYRTICPQSNYQNSLKVLELSSKNGFLTKTGLILGLGETIEEVKNTIQEAKAKGVHILTIGQYLQPSKENHPVQKYYPLETFMELKNFALKEGFLYVESGPLVRSSFHAEEAFNYIIKNFYKTNKN